MPRNLPVHRASALAVLLLWATGCDPGAGTLAVVRGKVFCKGVPLHTGTIVFAPDALRGSTGALARGEIQPDGSYALRTGDSPGAVVGWHRVTIAALDTVPSPAPGQPLAIPRSLIPEKYRDPELSGLSCEIQLGRENAIDFNLD